MLLENVPEDFVIMLRHSGTERYIIRAGVMFCDRLEPRVDNWSGAIGDSHARAIL